MGWTMTVSDDFRVIAWTRRAGNHLGLLLLLTLLSISVQSDVALPRERHFSWRTGQWGQCMGEECGTAGVQTRTAWCVHTEGWTAHHSHCQHAGKPEVERRCFKVCDWHQDLFKWEMSNWGSCALVSLLADNELAPASRTSDCVTAQHGIQRREVRCARTSNGTAVSSRICEFFSPKPPVEQACLIPCPQDCVVSDYTSWSSCSKTCGAGLQHRTRHVLATPMYGGAKCPNLTETRTCAGAAECPAGEGEHQYSLKAGPWAECRLPHHKDALLSGRTTVDFSSTTSSENNSVTHHSQPASPRQRSPHHLHHHHHHHHHHHPPVHNRYPLLWELEVGYQTRQLRCTRSDGKNTMLSLCTKDGPPPHTFKSCVMPKDCQTSDWSSWSPCSKTCRSTDLSPGYRLRSRTMTQIPAGGGGRCPALEEKEACNIIGDLLANCPRYEWRATDWEECHILPLLSQQDRRQANASALCGGGIQTRKTYCVQVLDNSLPRHRKEVSRPVNSRLCAAEEPPSAVQRCSVPCQRRCLLSQWSPWGACLHDNCNEPQGRRGFRQRRRDVLWESDSSLEGTCPHLLESVPCDHPACYLWQVQQQGRCIPAKGPCGPGAAARNVTCVNTEGEDVSPHHCEGEPPPPEAACEVPCPADCLVGSWSSWSPCSHSCAAKTSEGRQSRTRTVLALPGKGGKSCPAAAALEEWRLCSEQPCAVFYWETSAWGPCLNNVSIDLNLTGGQWNGSAACTTAGVQIRKVSCIKANAGPVVSKRCPDSTRPESLQSCLLPCKKDCIVTPFSEWTPCPSTCMLDNTTSPAQSRYRTIVQRSTNGGQECPDTLYEERECESLPVCPIYRWKTHKWHSCTVAPESVRRSLSAPTEVCGNGLETRGISCVGESGESANMTECLRWAGPLPLQVRECRVSCKDDCTLTAWSKFSDCAGCGSSRSRKRSLTGRSKKKELCLNKDSYPLEETETCPCDEFLSQPYGNWSDCILPGPPAPGSLKGWTRHREMKECGQGVRYQAVACIDQQGRLVDPTLCTETGYTLEVCHIPCPLDCKLSDWSPWSACSASCGSGLKTRSKWLREKAFNGGRPCPRLDLKNQVHEAVRCHSECSQYEWRSDSWSICTINAVDDLPACGEGVQSRKIRCVKKEADGEVSAVEASLCDQDEMPPRAQVCSLACPNECVAGSWGSWSSCPLQCDHEATRNRSRLVLRLPTTQDLSCPDLVQSEPCVLNSTCFTYQYRVSDWSTCQLSAGAVCGQGSRQRLLDCVRNDGKVVELHECRQFGVTSEQRLSESCAVDCPVSCLLSAWSQWAECSHTCGGRGQSVRSRRILQDAHEEGRPCPSQLTQTKPCPIRPCYTWVLSEWSVCAVEDAECGEGLQRRNLSCVVRWGGQRPDSPPRPAGAELCGDQLVRSIQQEMERPCFVPCPGDCHLTAWSSWSSCQLTCLEGRSFEATGRRARSRAVIVQAAENQGSCPQQVFETQTCKGGKCHSYEWRTGAWSNNRRAVWCQRSDGINVTGGCFPQKRPTTVRHCHPPCTKPFSHCTPSGVCGCERGYTEVMTTHGFLDYCTRTPGVSDGSKKADVKTGSSGRFRPGSSPAQDLFSEWTLRPIGPDGRVKLWVYAVTAIGFILILFVIALSFLLCMPSKAAKTSSPPPQKPLTLAYDGDVDM